MRANFAAAFASKTRDAWSEIFDGVDACVMPVLGLEEAALHPHNAARDLITTGNDGVQHPAPAPRLSLTPARPGM